MTEPVLRLEGLCKQFGGIKAVDNVSLDVPKGQIVGLIGPNGAGKTNGQSRLRHAAGVERPRAVQWPRHQP